MTDSNNSADSIDDLFGSKKPKKIKVEESDTGAKKSTLKIIQLCNSHKVDNKKGVALLDSAENFLGREVKTAEVEMIFYDALKHDYFSNKNQAPNGWRSESSFERINGRAFGKGIKD